MNSFPFSGIDGDHAIGKAVAFVKKPFDKDKLLGIVKRTIGQGNSEYYHKTGVRLKTFFNSDFCDILCLYHKPLGIEAAHKKQ